MKINGEEVELVTLFDELQPGMTCYVVGCVNCTKDHRCMLLNKRNDIYVCDVYGKLLPDGQICFETTCNHIDGYRLVIIALSVTLKKVYRIVDPLQETKEQFIKQVNKEIDCLKDVAEIFKELINE